MDVRFVPPDLRRLDALKTEALSLPFFSDDRPLRGALGLVDWRLCGRVSQLIVDGRIDGSAGETLLVPPRPRLTFDKLFLFGLGPRASFGGEGFTRSVERMLSTLSRARVRASVFALPGRADGLMEPVPAMEQFLAVASHHPEHDEITLIEDLEAQKAMAPIVEQARRRARAYVA